MKYLPHEGILGVKLGVLDPLEMMPMLPDLLKHRAQPLYRQLSAVPLTRKVTGKATRKRSRRESLRENAP